MSKKSLVTGIMLLVLFGFFTSGSAVAQKKNFDYSFYGFVRGDLYYNSRSNMEGVDGLYYLFPKDVLPDPDGKDLNATYNGSFYAFTTRMGFDMKGPNVGNAKTTAKIETDFGGLTDMNFLLRLRHAYVKLDWDKGSSLQLGHSWHPLFGEVLPTVLDLSTGAPFQPFSRCPLINYQYRRSGLTLTTAAMYQMIFTSFGPSGRGEQYIKNGFLPELYAGLSYRKNTFIVGMGADIISIKPRLQSVYNGNTFRVDERVTAFSYTLFAEYAYNKLKVSGKTLLTANQGHTNMIGGYGVSKQNSRTGEQEYTSFRQSVSWLNIVYGNQYQGALFAGYTKNLGTPDPLLNTTNLYGMGMDIDRFAHLSLIMRYVVPHWNFGFEYTLATAWYGDINLSNGKVKNTHDVTNHRMKAVFMYLF